MVQWYWPDTAVSQFLSFLIYNTKRGYINYKQYQIQIYLIKYDNVI